MTQDQGRFGVADRAGGLRPEPRPASQPKALIPSAIDRLAADMDAHGIKKCVRRPISGYCYVELHDGRTGTGNTFRDALRAAEGASERIAA